MIEQFSAHALHYWSLEFASWSLHVGFIVNELESGQVFLTISTIFPVTKFHCTLTSSILFKFDFICSCVDATDFVRWYPYRAQTLSDKGFISSHP